MKIRFIDFLLWPIAFVVVYAITHVTLAGIFYAFEFIIRYLSKLKFFFYLILLIPAVSFLYVIAAEVLKLLCNIAIVFLVRQCKSFTTVFGILFSIEIIIALILFWFGIIEFSWESYSFVIMNKIAFSILFISLLYIPFAIYEDL